VVVVTTVGCKDISYSFVDRQGTWAIPKSTRVLCCRRKVPTIDLSIHTFPVCLLPCPVRRGCMTVWDDTVENASLSDHTRSTISAVRLNYPFVCPRMDEISHANQPWLLAVISGWKVCGGCPTGRVGRRDGSGFVPQSTSLIRRFPFAFHNIDLGFSYSIRRGHQRRLRAGGRIQRLASTMLAARVVDR